MAIIGVIDESRFDFFSPSKTCQGFQAPGRWRLLKRPWNPDTDLLCVCVEDIYLYIFTYDYTHDSRCDGRFCVAIHRTISLTMYMIYIYIDMYIYIYTVYMRI